MTFLRLLLQSLTLLVLFAVVLLSPVLYGGLPGEGFSELIFALFLIAYLIYVLVHKSSYSDFSQETVESIQTRTSWLKSTSLAVTIVTVGLQALAGVMVTLYVVFLMGSILSPPPEGTNTASQMLLDVGRGLTIGIYSVAAILSYLALFFFPFFVSLPIAASIGRQWKHPGRFLLLRPFNRQYATRPLRAIVRKEIAFYGHTYTLADASIKIPWYVRIPVFVGQLGFLQFRMRRIKNQRGLDKLGRVLENRWMRNLNWCMSRGKVFAIATIDNFWQACISQMIPLADVIFIDLSELRDNIIWEIEQCKQLGAAERIIFLVQDDIHSEAAQYLANYFDDGLEPPRLFQYSEAGTLVGTDFQSTLAGLLVSR